MGTRVKQEDTPDCFIVESPACAAVVPQNYRIEDSGKTLPDENQVPLGEGALGRDCAAPLALFVAARFSLSSGGGCSTRLAFNQAATVPAARSACLGAR